MSVEIKIPAVGESITSGLLSNWHKDDGEGVSAGDVLLTLETDKVSTELTAEKSGVLKIIVPAGEEVKIGQIVGSIEEGSGTVKATPEVVVAEKPAAAPAAVPAPKAAAAPEKPAPKSAPAPVVTPAASPALAAAIAQTQVTHDNAATIAQQAPVASSDGRITRKRMSPIRRKIAAQLVMAQQTAAILTTFNECDMSAVMKLRSEMQESFTKEHGVKLGFMSFFVKAVVGALKVVPSINSRIEGEELVENHYFDIGVAVGTERGLVVPVIRGAEGKSFADIERDIAAYSVKARDNKIKIEDLQGGVFTISNGGIYGSLLSTPILNPPQSGILGMHKIQERPIAVKGQVVIRPMMYLALSYDHRVVDGKEAVTFLIRVKDALENPARLLLGL